MSVFVNGTAGDVYWVWVGVVWYVRFMSGKAGHVYRVGTGGSVCLGWGGKVCLLGLARVF